MSGYGGRLPVLLATAILAVEAQSIATSLNCSDGATTVIANNSTGLFCGFSSLSAGTITSTGMYSMSCSDADARAIVSANTWGAAVLPPSGIAFHGNLSCNCYGSGVRDTKASVIVYTALSAGKC